MMQAIEFNTKRLAFRAWQDQHRAPLAAMNADAEVMRYFPGLLSPDQTNAGIDIWRQQFAENGWSNWAVELLATGEFMGFIGLSVPRRQLPFSPCVEIGWRLKRSAWGKGYATEGAQECLRIAFEQLGLEEVVSFTTLTNRRSVKVMERIGMTHANADFEHPAVPEGHALRPHCLYKITRAQWRRGDACRADVAEFQVHDARTFAPAPPATPEPAAAPVLPQESAEPDSRLLRRVQAISRAADDSNFDPAIVAAARARIASYSGKELRDLAGMHILFNDDATAEDMEHFWMCKRIAAELLGKKT